MSDQPLKVHRFVNVLFIRLNSNWEKLFLFGSGSNGTKLQIGEEDGEEKFIFRRGVEEDIRLFFLQFSYKA